MTDVIIEREYETALAEEDIFAMANAGRGCLELYNVEWKTSYLAANGKRLVCQFVAPDAESLRTSLRQLKVEVNALWPATLHHAVSDLIANVVVERNFEGPVTLESIQAIEDAASSCLELRDVTFVNTWFARDHKRMLCFYHAPDAESVRQAQDAAKMPVARVWACKAISPTQIAG
jgi:hypothetical protein